MLQALRRQDGQGRAGCILWTLAVVIAAMIAFKAIPVKIATMELKDEMRQAAQRMPTGKERDYVNYIVGKAQERDLPVSKENVKVKKLPDRVIMDVNFTVVLDFIVMDYDWNIELHVDRDIYRF